MIGRTDWRDIPDLVRENRMGFLIGNGLSRLSGAPSWADLFNSPRISQILKGAGLSHAAPYLELGYFLATRHPVEWEALLRRLLNWSQSPLTRRNTTHRALLEVLRPPKLNPPSLSLLTTNVDALLETGEYGRSNIGYVHGEPNSPQTWIFTAEDYWDNWHQGGRIEKVFRNFNVDGVLFLGYGHSHEDFDIVQSIIALREKYFGRMFTLMPDREANRSDVRCRLDWQGIGDIRYQVPVDATSLEREVFLTSALLDLAEDCGFDTAPDRQNVYHELRQWCAERIAERQKRRSNALVVLGLAGVNRHAELSSAVPSSERRVAVAAKMRIEAGGPAFIVSEIARATGLDSLLVSKIASDEQGALVLNSIRRSSTLNNARIFEDYIENVPPEETVTGFKTWDSFILEPNDRLSHRVFIDREVDAGKLDLSEETKNSIIDMLRDGSGRIFYFDRHYRGTILQLLRSPFHPPIAPDVWTVYETDSDGDRYAFMHPGMPFDEARAFEFEKHLAATGLQCLNVVAASFRFARDCLGVHYGRMPRPQYEDLISRDDSPEIIGRLMPTHSEDQVIGALVSDGVRLAAFADAVRKGADQFLRIHPLRLVIITLHRHGSLALTVPPIGGGPPAVHYVPGHPPGSGRLYTASAGDVFRGALVAAFGQARANGFNAADIMGPAFVQSLLELCNRCASAKVASPTVTESLIAITKIFDEWGRDLDRLKIKQ